VVQNDKEKYKATAKGMDFLQRYHEITELLKSDDENKNDIKIPPPHLLKRSQNLA
jgi:hypothetical protein